MTRIVDGIKGILLSIMIVGCASTNSGKLYMEYKSDMSKVSLSHDKIVVERIIARW